MKSRRKSKQKLLHSRPTHFIHAPPKYFLALLVIIAIDNHNALTIATLWLPVLAIYALDLQIFYTLLSAVIGGLIEA